jgi:kynurenine formamidase
MCGDVLEVEMRLMSLGVVVGSIVAGAALGASGQVMDLSRSRLVDLTHPYNAQTIYWPTASTRFNLEKLAYGPAPGGYFYASFSFSTPEHGGTHLDAPLHFSERGRSTDQVPLDQLIARAVVIDVSSSAADNPDYRLSANDVQAFERQHGQIAAGTIVLLRTDWSRRWPDVKAYLGDDTPGDASKLRFPSYGEDAARLLVEERRAGALGVDTASIDYGRSTDFVVHRTAAAQQVAGLENLTNLDQVPATGATIIALPIKIEGGSGGPVRVVAVVPAG